MKLLRVKVIKADTCGGLMDDLEVIFRSPNEPPTSLEPLCLVGPNGTGKSQLLQLIAEIFQSLYHTSVPEEERLEGNPGLQFEVEYLLNAGPGLEPAHVRASRRVGERGRPIDTIETKVEGAWETVDIAEAAGLLPAKVVGYTSGGNETLSLPFLISRSAYADEVGKRALSTETSQQVVPDTRLLLIDYQTHIELLVANLILGSEAEREAILREAHLRDLRSFRCTIQLNRPGGPKGGIQLTDELRSYVDSLRDCATSFEYDPKRDTYVLDYLIGSATRLAFADHFTSPFELYSALHKVAMLNDLAISKRTRDRFKRDTQTRRFASRLPEPQDEEKVFRFDSVEFSTGLADGVVDYVSLSDGEHQMAQVLGLFSMVTQPNVLFVLDEPESHFNPQWRVRFMARVFERDGTATGSGLTAPANRSQECLLTTHAPFVPSDLPRERVFIFSKASSVEVVNPEIETYGTTFDSILDACFEVRPPISDVSRSDIDELMANGSPEEIEEGLSRLGDSVEKVLLLDRLRALRGG